MSKSYRGGTRLQTEDSVGSPRRKTVNKKASAKAFNSDASRTHPRNIAAAPMRGGIRL